ncbi:endothelin-converting enzyme 1-like isoform X2 [Nilaparvata lugens]|uniref:endothelin-converting enzyme 1-like isoform X2 n=1 Tax=Nilaparvata lugens TaxID=108931 RepID=UPI00193DE8BF|nr:endothelin-converting enzyme 1-like isoform X2 [Nilaparvata lugens]
MIAYNNVQLMFLIIIWTEYCGVLKVQYCSSFSSIETSIPIPDVTMGGDRIDIEESTETDDCTESNPKDLKKCSSKYCKKEASSILYKMNFMADKCQDFYDYACGNMRAMEHGDELAFVWDTIKREIGKIDDSRPQIEMDLKSFFKSCMDQAKTDNKLKKYAGRKLITSIGRISNDFHVVENLTDVIIFLIQMNSLPLFDVSLEIDKGNPSRLALTLSPPLQDGISLFDVYNEKERRCIEESTPSNIRNSQSINLKDSYHNYNECKKNHTSYISAIHEAMEEFELIDNSTDVESIIEDIENIITEIFESAPDFMTLEKDKTSFNNEVLTVGALKDIFKGSVDWVELFNALVNSTIDSNTEIHVYGKKYFEKIGGTIMIESELWKIKNFLLANFAHNIFEYFYKVKNDCNREEYCLQLSSRLLPDVVSNLYVTSLDKMDLQKARKSAMDSFHLIKENMLRELNNKSNAILVDEESRHNLVLHKIHPAYLMTDFTEYAYLDHAVMLVARYQLLKFSTYNMRPDSQQVM